MVNGYPFQVFLDNKTLVSERVPVFKLLAGLLVPYGVCVGAGGRVGGDFCFGCSQRSKFSTLHKL